MMDFESLYARATQALDSQIIINVQQAERIKELEAEKEKLVLDLLKIDHYCRTNDIDIEQVLKG